MRKEEGRGEKVTEGGGRRGEVRRKGWSNLMVHNGPDCSNTRALKTNCHQLPHLGGRSMGGCCVFLSSSSMRPTFHCSRNTCHVPRQKVVTGIVRSHSFLRCRASFC